MSFPTLMLITSALFLSIVLFHNVRRTNLSLGLCVLAVQIVFVVPLSLALIVRWMFENAYPTSPAAKAARLGLIYKQMYPPYGVPRSPIPGERAGHRRHRH